MTAARYFQRAPRYIFRPDDERLMRFAEMETRNSALRARIHDLSATGISFVVESNESPMTGDLLKIEFGLPGDRQVAWFATVVRVEHKTDWDPDVGEREYTLVGLRFRQLPAPFTNAIKRSLDRRLDGNDGSPLLNAGHDFTHERRMTLVLGAALFFCMLMMAIPLQSLLG